MRIIFFLLAVMPSLAFAGEHKSFKDAMQPLQFLIGDWSIDWKTQQPDGSWQDFAVSPSTFAKVAGQSAISETFAVPGSAVTYNLFAVYSFDEARQVYRLAGIDDVSGLLDVYEGHLKNGMLTLDNTKSKTFTETDDGALLAFRLNYDLSKQDHMEAFIEISTDEGKTWAPYMKGIYTRK